MRHLATEAVIQWQLHISETIMSIPLKFKTIADFRRDNGSAIRAVCSQFVALCRRLDLLTHAVVAIDGSKFKTVNNRAKNYTVTKVEKRTRLLRSARRPLQTRYFHGLGRTSRSGVREGLESTLSRHSRAVVRGSQMRRKLPLTWVRPTCGAAFELDRRVRHESPSVQKN